MVTVDRILQLVNDSGLTAKQFAEEAGIAGGSITDWKTGRSKPSVESLQKISKYANVNLEWLTGDSKFKTNNDRLSNFLKDEAYITILETAERYYDEYVFPCSISEENLNYISELIINLNPNNIKETKKKKKDFISTFPVDLQPKVKDFFNILIKSVIKDIERKNIYYYLVSLIDNDKKNQFYMCPVYGRISAGQPNWAEECIEGRIPIDPELMDIINPEEYFFLRVNGESMNKVVKNGAYALIHKQDMVENGEIAVVLVNGYEATLKQFSRQDNLIILNPKSDSDEFEPIVVDLSKTEFKILGKYVGKLEINK